MVIGVFFMLLGAVGLVAALQWQSGRWLESARWIARNSTVHLLYAIPMAALLVGCLGLSIIWPPAIVLVFLAAGAFPLMLFASPYRRRAQARVAVAEAEAHSVRARIRSGANRGDREARRAS